MGSWVWIGFLAFFVASLSVGTRLLLLWRRTRELPELLIGIGVLGIGPVGFGISMLGSALVSHGVVELESIASRVPFAIGTLSVMIGVFAKCVFNWRVYHPDRPAVKAGVMAIGVVLAGLYAYSGVARGFIPAPGHALPSLLQSTLQVSALLWGSFEALRYWGLMRRRAVLGLSDPVVTNRFLLWAIGAGAAGLGTAIGTIAGAVMQVQTLQIPWVVASSSAHGMLAAVAMWLAFVPPSGYLRWMRGDQDVAGAGAVEG